jgi:hypothetical protein
MPRTTLPGAGPLTLRAWPFGAPSRRRLLEIVLLTSAPAGGWTKSGLERACEVTNGTLDEHLANMVDLGLLTMRDRRFFRPSPSPPLAHSLRAVLRHTASLPEIPATPLPRRPYRRR